MKATLKLWTPPLPEGPKGEWIENFWHCWGGDDPYDDVWAATVLAADYFRQKGWTPYTAAKVVANLSTGNEEGVWIRMKP